jgi:hypothetical protein
MEDSWPVAGTGLSIFPRRPRTAGKLTGDEGAGTPLRPGLPPTWRAPHLRNSLFGVLARSRPAKRAPATGPLLRGGPCRSGAPASSWRLMAALPRVSREFYLVPSAGLWRRDLSTDIREGGVGDFGEWWDKGFVGGRLRDWLRWGGKSLVSRRWTRIHADEPG